MMTPPTEYIVYGHDGAQRNKEQGQKVGHRDWNKVGSWQTPDPILAVHSISSCIPKQLAETVSVKPCQGSLRSQG